MKNKLNKIVLSTASAVMAIAPSIVLADTIKVKQPVDVYMDSYSAKAGRNSAAVWSAGDYHIFKENDLAINITRIPNVPGGWVSKDVLNNVGNKAKEAIKEEAKVTESVVAESPKVAEGEYNLERSHYGYYTSANARTQTNQTTILSKGKYYIFKEYNGMYNLTKVKGVPGAWVNLNGREVSNTSARSSNTNSEGAKEQVTSSSTSSNQAMVDLAEQQVGKRYVWGGSGPNSFDCSGLVKYLLQNVKGMNVPHTARIQSTIGTDVSLDNIQPGDFIYFANSSEGGVFHVGIYAGNGKYIHASTPERGVVKDSIYSSWFKNNFYKAKRIN